MNKDQLFSFLFFFEKNADVILNFVGSMCLCCSLGSDYSLAATLNLDYYLDKSGRHGS